MRASHMQEPLSMPARADTRAPDEALAGAERICNIFFVYL